VAEPVGAAAVPLLVAEAAPDGPPVELEGAQAAAALDAQPARAQALEAAMAAPVLPFAAQVPLD